EVIANRLISQVSDWVTRRGAPGVTTLFALAILEEHDLTPEEVMQVLARLKSAGMLTTFFELHQDPRLRPYLERKSVPLEFVYSNWESTANDSLAVFAGFLFGVGESFYDCVRLVYTLVGSVLSEELAAERDQFFHALNRLLTHPLVIAQQGVSHLV